MPGGSLTSKPTWSNTFGCSATSAFFVCGDVVPLSRQRTSQETCVGRGYSIRCACRFTSHWRKKGRSMIAVRTDQAKPFHVYEPRPEKIRRECEEIRGGHGPRERGQNGTLGRVRCGGRRRLSGCPDSSKPTKKSGRPSLRISSRRVKGNAERIKSETLGLFSVGCDRVTSY